MYIQVSLEDFDEAQPGERVLGTWRKAVIVSVVLGEEVEHRPSRDDDPNTEYRCFRHCRVSYHRNMQEALLRRAALTSPDETVLLFV